MDAQEKLSDLRNLYNAISSQRAAQIRLVCSVGYRKRRLKNVIHRIRALRLALGRAVQELLSIREATNGVIDAKVVAYDNRLAELRSAIIHAEQRVRIERLLKIKAQMDALGMELPAELLAQVQSTGVAPAEPDMSPDPDDDLILS